MIPNYLFSFLSLYLSCFQAIGADSTLQAKLREKLLELEETCCGGECLYQVLVEVLRCIEEHLEEQEEEEEEELDDDDDDDERQTALLLGEVDLGGGLGGSGSDAPIVLGRRLCFSHHIIAPSKRSAVINWAVQVCSLNFVKTCCHFPSIKKHEN